MNDTWPKVAIIVLNWNGWRNTIECLESVRELTYPNYLTIVVDNGSWDDSLKRIKEWAIGKGLVLAEYNVETTLKGGEESHEEALEDVPSKNKLVLIKNEENLGFCGGNNVAIHYALNRKYHADFVFLLNNDATVEKDCLTKLVEVASKSGAGIVGARVKEEGEPRVWVGLVHQFFDPIVRPTLPLQAEKEFCPALWVCGAAMLIHKEVLNAICSSKSYLNSDLFVYSDELDFCMRASKAGYSTVLARQAFVHHKPAKSSGGSYNPIVYYYIERNRLLLAKKLLPLQWKVLFYPIGLLLSLGRVLKNIIARRPYSAWAILCGWWDGHRGVTGKWKYHDQVYLRRKGK